MMPVVGGQGMRQLRGKVGLTLLAQQLRVCPVEARASAGKHLHRIRQQIDQLGVPLPHLSSRAPERTEDGAEVAPATLFQTLYELATLPLGGARTNHLERGAELFVGFRVVHDRVADVEDNGPARSGPVELCRKRKGGQGRGGRRARQSRHRGR